MRRMPSTLFICALLSSAPLLTPSLALAEPAGTTERSAAQPASPSRSPGDMSNGVARDAITVPGVQSTAPTTPMPLNLPDEATAKEVQSEYAIGVTSLIIGGLLIAAIVIGVLLMISRRSWSASH